jgi:hypothetical protein
LSDEEAAAGFWPSKRAMILYISLIVQNYLVRPSFRTRAAARVNVDDSTKGCMAGAFAVFAKCHFIDPG